MRIRTQLRISLLILAATLAIAAASLFSTIREIGRKVEQERIAARIARISEELIYLSEDYMLYGETRQLDRWHSRFDGLSAEVARLEPDGAEQRDLVRSIKTDQQWLKEAFVGWTSAPGDQGSNRDRLFLHAFRSRMIVQGNALLSNASRLENAIRSDADRAKRNNMIVVYTLAGVLVLLLIVDHFMIQRRTLRSIKALQEGTEVVGSGNFDFTIEATRDDEIGALKRSFSEMAGRLKAATAKRSDLENEIRERKATEEALRQSEEGLRSGERRLMDLLAEKEALLKEIHHRVKNNMQVISSLVDLQADAVDDPFLKGIFREINFRVRSMAMVHEKLYQSADLARVEFADYIESLLGYMWHAQGASASRIEMALELERVFLPVTAAVPCGLILNELFSNALKHAFRGRPGGKLTVSLRSGAEGKVFLAVRDDGIGLPPELDWKLSNTLGLRIVRTLARQLHAAVDVDTVGGTAFTIRFDQPIRATVRPVPGA